MKHFKPIDHSQSFLIPINRDSVIANNPLIGALERYFDRFFDEEPFTRAIKNELNGAPAYHPSVMLKTLFYSYSKGMYSSREIESLCRSDYGAIYLSANIPIDHSTVCRFISIHSKEIVEFFTKMTYVLRKLNLVDYDLLAIDGTKIRANASKEFSGNVRDFKDKRLRIEKKLKAALDDTSRTHPRIEIKIDRFERSLAKIDEFISGTDGSDPTKINLIDRDARLMKDGGNIVVGYNCQNAIDSRHHFIVGNDVTNHSNDRNELVPMLDRLDNSLHDKSKVTADAGYFSSDNLIQADDRHIDLYLPEGRNQDGSQKKKDDDAVKSKDCAISREGETRFLTCPGGYRSSTGECSNDGRNFTYRFYVPASRCSKCSHREKCNPHYTDNRSKRFNVKREYFDSADLRDAMKKKLYSEEGRSIYNQRACLVEHVFGEIKTHKRFTRFWHRGLPKVRVIWNIVCIAYNFRKMTSLEVFT